MERRESGGWKEEYLSEVSLVLKLTSGWLSSDSQPVRNVESTLLLLLCNSTRLLNSPTQSSLLLKPLILPTTFWFTVLFRTKLTSERYSSFQPPLTLPSHFYFSIYFPQSLEDLHMVYRKPLPWILILLNCFSIFCSSTPSVVRRLRLLLRGSLPVRRSSRGGHSRTLTHSIYTKIYQNSKVFIF